MPTFKNSELVFREKFEKNSFSQWISCFTCKTQYVRLSNTIYWLYQAYAQGVGDVQNFPILRKSIHFSAVKDVDLQVTQVTAVMDNA